MKHMRHIIIYLICIFPLTCLSYDRTEAQRYYDLSLSYMKSGLYEKGLETLNQVAFLYPDSDVADDALYQLILLRERAGDGEISIGEIKANVIDDITLNKINLNMRYTPNNSKWIIQSIVNSLGDIITMSNKKKAIIEAQKIQAINEYILAIDYLNTAFERYPESDINDQLELVYNRIANKLDSLTKPKQISIQEKPESTIVSLSAIFIATLFLGLGALSFIYLTN